MRKLTIEEIKETKFTRLQVLAELPFVIQSGRHRRRMLCLCDCGKKISTNLAHLTSGDTKSCGCYNTDRIRERSTTHGFTRGGNKYPPEYMSWASMIQRCENPNCKSYSYYGGRGIKVCKEWHTFINFYRDMGKRPKGKSLDRINNNGNYEPKNCRWATKKQQMNNRRAYNKRTI